jgi:hypothetical protein
MYSTYTLVTLILNFPAFSHSVLSGVVLSLSSSVRPPFPLSPGSRPFPSSLPPSSQASDRGNPVPPPPPPPKLLCRGYGCKYSCCCCCCSAVAAAEASCDWPAGPVCARVCVLVSPASSSMSTVNDPNVLHPCLSFPRQSLDRSLTALAVLSLSFSLSFSPPSLGEFRPFKPTGLQ